MLLDTLSPGPRIQRLSRPTIDGDLPDPVLALAVRRDGPAMLIAVTGEVDMSNAHLLVELVTFACRPPRPLVVLDLSATVFFDAHAVTALLRAHRAVAAAGGRLTVRDPSPFVLRLLGVAGVLGHLAITVGLPPSGADDAPPPPGARPEAANSGAHRYPRAGATTPRSWVG
jgi:anti-anti-sigma factor